MRKLKKRPNRYPEASTAEKILRDVIFLFIMMATIGLFTLFIFVAIYKLK